MMTSTTIITGAHISMTNLERAIAEGVDAFFLGCAVALADSPECRQRRTGIHMAPASMGGSVVKAFREGYLATVDEPVVNTEELRKVEAILA